MQGRRWLIDGMNVIGASPDGWWRDRDGAVRRLLGQLQRLAASGELLTLVLDGEPIPGLTEGEHDGVEVRYAIRGGPDAADDRIVALARERPDAVRVVTSDRALRRRVEELGCRVEGASALRRRLDRLEPGS